MSCTASKTPLLCSFRDRPSYALEKTFNRHFYLSSGGIKPLYHITFTAKQHLCILMHLITEIILMTSFDFMKNSNENKHVNRPTVLSQSKLSALKQWSKDAERMRLDEPGKKSMACTVKSNSHGFCCYKLPKSMKPEGGLWERMPIFIHCQKVFCPIKRENWCILVPLVSVVKIWEEWVRTPPGASPSPAHLPHIRLHKWMPFYLFLTWCGWSGKGAETQMQITSRTHFNTRSWERSWTFEIILPVGKIDLNGLITQQ